MKSEAHIHVFMAWTALQMSHNAQLKYDSLPRCHSAGSNWSEVMPRVSSLLNSVSDGIILTVDVSCTFIEQPNSSTKSMNEENGRLFSQKGSSEDFHLLTSQDHLARCQSCQTTVSRRPQREWRWWLHAQRDQILSSSSNLTEVNSRV